MSIAGPILIDVRLGAPRRLSVAADGGEAGHESRNPRWGADGSVLFESPAPDLAPADDNSTWDVFRLAGSAAPAAVSRDSLGHTGSGVSLGGAMSRDGRLLLFDSSAANLVPFDLNGARDVFVRNLATGEVRLVSASAGGAAGSGDSFAGVFTPDGGGVLFESLASDLVPGDTNLTRDLFLKDLATGAIARVSVGPAGEEALGQSGGAMLSGSGRWLLFESNAPNLVAGDTNGAYDIFLKDLASGFVRRLSVAADGAQGNGHSLRARFTADESAVVFETLASNLIAGDSNGARDIVRVDLVTGAVTRLSLGIAGQQANGSSLAASLGGGWLAFETHATNLGGGDGNGRRDIWLRDLVTGAMLRVLGAGGAEPNGDSLNAQLSPDGERLLFESFASNLVAGDTNGVRDVFEVAVERAVLSATGSGSGGALGGLLLFDDPDPLAQHGWVLDAPPSPLGAFAVALDTPAAGAAVGALRWTFTPGAGALALRAGEERTLAATLAVIGPTGARAEQALTVTLAGAEDAPVAADDRVALRSGETSADLWPVLLANDRDPDAGDTLAIARVDLPPQGTLSFDAAARSLAFTADAALAGLPSGAIQPVRFAYWVIDATGLEARAEVEIEVRGILAKAQAGTPAADLLAGTIGPDWLAGLAGEDALGGGEGDDRLDGGSGADRMEGGAGDDVFVVDHAGDVIVERTGEGVDTVEALAGVALPAGVEDLRLLGDGLAGAGNALANTLTGTAGPDLIDGAAGPDRLVGGAGNDIIIVDHDGDVVVELAGGGHDTVETTLAAHALPDHVETLRFTGAGAFEGRGNGLDNLLTGGAGADRLAGLGSDDLIDGGAGDDWVDGGPGADRLRGGPGADQFILRRSEAAGDWILDFEGGGGGPGDMLRLLGWGAGTRLVEGPGSQEWTIIDGIDGHRETLRIVGALDPSDMLFG